ncbi:MAG: hypothetical protein K2J11_09425 [Oscillospiraceae bacterium]|nr:hypothetical protein [Oscillospiraceae bacterium]
MYAYYIKKAANSFVRDHAITARAVTSVEFLSAVAEKESYSVYRFDGENDRLIQALKVESFCRTNIAFTVCQGDMRCIFIKSDVPDKAAAKLLLHELAHIRLRHLDKCKTTAFVSENDADAFVNYVRASVYGNARPARRIVAVIMLCLALPAVFCAIHSRDTSDSEAVPVVNEVSVTDTYTVYITDTGEKYHEQNCYHLKGRHVTAVDIELAESLGKEPCKDCILK